MNQEEKPKSYSELLLGDALETILEATEQAIPTISENRFVNEVLPILERPFRHASLSNYVRFVGELTNPLRVLSDNDANNTLFIVPALIQTTGVTLPMPGAPTSDNALKDIYAQSDRGVDINPYIANYMSKVTARPDMFSKVLDPIREILTRYGRTMDLSDEVNVDLPKVETETKVATVPAADTSFTGDYE